ncbi:MAG: NAD(P)H-hydrate dehydratase [Clostridia bacterium]|nr:NAD(P)H-hydrate dehydratase [Clostridia bacterium]
MKQVEQKVIEGYGLSSLILMEKAALSVFESLRERNIKLNHTLILCGTGNNGADGLALARIMCDHHYHPDVYICGNMNHATKEFTKQLQILAHYDVSILTDLNDHAYITIIDAIFGIGLSRNIEHETFKVIQKINEMDAFKVAVDIPSGIDANTGQIRGIAVKADLTVTFAYQKIGHLLYPGRSYTGELLIKNIGLNYMADDEIPDCYTLTKEDLFVPERIPDANKGTYGKLLVIAGSKDICGAALLCVLAAFKMGTGMVKLMTHSKNRELIISKIPECMLICYDDTIDQHKFKEAIEWSTAVVAGPGISTEPVAVAICRYLLTIKNKPVVLDADALNIISKEKLLEDLSDNMIVTPHIGEMSRLTNQEVPAIKQESIRICDEFANKHQVVCVMKDASTIVASDRRNTYINTSGNSGMATAGSGDVLAGIIGAYCAMNTPLDQSAVNGVLIHGLAGDMAKEKHGEAAMMPSDLIEELKELL